MEQWEPMRFGQSCQRLRTTHKRVLWEAIPRVPEYLPSFSHSLIARVLRKSTSPDLTHAVAVAQALYVRRSESAGLDD